MTKDALTAQNLPRVLVAVSQESWVKTKYI